MTSETELQQMIELGVGEVFVGYVPPSWLETLGVEVSPNRRYQLERQISDIGILHRFGEICRAHDVGFVVAINDHCYSPDARALIPEIVQTGLGAGATGFIVADLQLLSDLSLELGGKIDLIASCEAGVYNAETALQLVELGATRLIFAREMRLSEMGKIVEATRSDTVSYEAFIAREYCVYSSACCFAAHGYGQTVHFCCAPTRRSLVDMTTGSSTILDDSEPGWCQEPRFLEAAHALNRCGFCALDTFRKLGVRFLKIPGRSDSALRALGWLRALLDSGDLSIEACRSAIDSDAFCADGNRCYYNVTSEMHRDLSPPRVSTAKRTGPAELTPPSATSSSSEPAESLTFAAYLSVDELLSERIERLSATGFGGLLESNDFVADWEKETANTTLTALRRISPETATTPNQVVLGMEMCGLRLPKPSLLRRHIEVVKRAGCSVSLALPIAYQAFWDDICELVEGVVELEVELIINDWGLLRYAASHWDARLAIGRLLNRMKRDQFALDDDIRPVAVDDSTSLDHLNALRQVQSSAYGYPYLNEKVYCDLLRRFRVENVATDLLPTPLSAELSSQFRHTIYLPWAYVTSGRSCRTASAVEGAVISYPTEACRRSCSQYVILPDFPFKAYRTVQRGSAVFIDCSRHVEGFFDSASKGVTRVVWEPFVPY